MLGFWIGIGLALLGIFLGNPLLVVFGLAALAAFFALSPREARQVIVPAPAGAPAKKRYRVLAVPHVEEEWPLETMEGPLPGVLKQLPLSFMPGGRDPIFARELMGIPPKGAEEKYFRGMDPFRQLLLKQRDELRGALEGMKKNKEEELEGMRKRGKSLKEMEEAKGKWEEELNAARDDMAAGAWKKGGGTVMWRRDALPFPQYGLTNPVEKIFIGLPINLGSMLLRRAYTREQLQPGKETIAYKQLKKVLFGEEKIELSDEAIKKKKGEDD